MKTCPKCNRTYPDDAPGFCPQDGTQLVNDAQAYNPQPTMPSPPLGYPQQLYPQQQWGRPEAQRGNKTLLFVIVGLIVAVGAGLTIYFLMRGSGSSSNYTTSNSTSSMSSNQFVGTWWIDTGSGPSDDFIRVIKPDGTFTDNYKGTTSKGTYTLTGDTLVIPAGKDTTQVWTFIGPDRVKATEKIGSDSQPLGEWVRRPESASGSTSSTTL
jgi:hypothetical protein